MSLLDLTVVQKNLSPDLREKMSFPDLMVLQQNLSPGLME